MNISINIIIRYLISILFFVSAITKLYPFEMMQGIEKGFVQGQLVPMGFTEILASYFARFIIAVEFFIALAFLQRNYLKKIIIPFSILLVSVFTFHLLYKVALGDSSNCGCFGELIKMTPLEAVIKNILTLVALIFLYIKSSEK